MSLVFAALRAGIEPSKVDDIINSRQHPSQAGEQPIHSGEHRTTYAPGVGRRETTSAATIDSDNRSDDDSVIPSLRVPSRLENRLVLCRPASSLPVPVASGPDVR